MLTLPLNHDCYCAQNGPQTHKAFKVITLVTKKALVAHIVIIIVITIIIIVIVLSTSEKLRSVQHSRWSGGLLEYTHSLHRSISESIRDHPA